MEPQKEIHPYQELYGGFLSSYKRGMCSGEEVGEIIVRLAECYANYNLKLVYAERGLSIKAQEFETRVDDNGKPISSAKAKVHTDASVEAFEFNKARMHLQNIEMHIGALKSLQRGILAEMGHSGL